MDASRSTEVPRDCQHRQGQSACCQYDKPQRYWRNAYNRSLCTRDSFVKAQRGNDRVRSLRLFLDDDSIIRCAGRLENADLPKSAVSPKLLPTKHPYTRSLIAEVHRHTLHSGVSQSLAQLRQTHWIVHGRSEVKRVIRQCRTCRKWEGRPYSVPQFPSLPSQRVKTNHAFKH